MVYKIAAANAGERLAFRCAVHRHRPGVAELWSLGRFAHDQVFHHPHFGPRVHCLLRLRSLVLWMGGDCAGRAGDSRAGTLPRLGLVGRFVRFTCARSCYRVAHGSDFQSERSSVQMACWARKVRSATTPASTRRPSRNPSSTSPPSRIVKTPFYLATIVGISLGGTFSA